MISGTSENYKIWTHRPPKYYQNASEDEENVETSLGHIEFSYLRIWKFENFENLENRRYHLFELLEFRNVDFWNFEMLIFRKDEKSNGDRKMMKNPEQIFKILNTNLVPVENDETRIC